MSVEDEKKCNKPESMPSASTNVNTQVILKVDIVNICIKFSL